MTAIELRDVAVSYGKRRVLTDVNWRVETGELVSVLGPNGAGKTTMLRAILGLVPSQGVVRVDGLAPSKASIGYVPQRHEFAWDFPISVEQVVMTGRTRQIGWLRTPRRADYAAVAEALRLAELTDLAGRTVGQLSGGQRQRVLIARALASQPRVLLLDEPFTGLDLPTQELLTTLHLALVSTGVTIVMTTHDLVQAMLHSDRVALVKGTIVAEGRPDELRDTALWGTVFGVRGDSLTGLDLDVAC